MTREEKQLLFKDLCARLPYHPKGVKLNTPFDPKDITIVGYIGRFVETVDDEIEVERVRLYLRPMSSMTEEENEELKYVIELGLQALEGEEGHNTVSAAPAAFEIDFYNKRHFDYRGLIPMGLAFEAPVDMYKQ